MSPTTRQLVVPEKNTYLPHGRSDVCVCGVGGGGGGCLRLSFLQAIFENKLEFHGGGGGA